MSELLNPTVSPVCPIRLSRQTHALTRYNTGVTKASGSLAPVADPAVVVIGDQ